MNSYNMAFYVLPGFLYGFIELIGVGVAVALYLSNRRAHTEADHYIVSPRYKPTLRTPKLAFIPVSLSAATTFSTSGVLYAWPGQLNPVIAFVGQALFWLSMVGMIVGLAIMLATSRPIEDRTIDRS